jgi:hypothetical protein
MATDDFDPDAYLAEKLTSQPARVMEYGPIAGEYHHAAMYGPQGNQLTDYDVAASPDYGFNQGDWVTVNGRLHRVGDLSYRAPGVPNRRTIELRDQHDQGHGAVALAPPFDPDKYLKEKGAAPPTSPDQAPTMPTQVIQPEAPPAAEDVFKSGDPLGIIPKEAQPQSIGDQIKDQLSMAKDYLKQPSPDWLQRIEKPIRESAPAQAAAEVAAGFIPTTAKAVAEFATPLASIPDEASNLYHAATDLIGGKSIDDVVKQYYPESQNIAEAEKTPAWSKERWRAGLTEVTQLLLGKQIAGGLHAGLMIPDKLKATLTDEQQAALIAQDEAMGPHPAVVGTPGYARVAPGPPTQGIPPADLPSRIPPPGSLTTTVLSPEDLMTPAERQTRRAAAEQGIQEQRTQQRIDEMAQQIFEQGKAEDTGGAGSRELRLEERIAKQREAAHTVSEDPEVLAAFEQAHKMASEAVDQSRFAPAEHAKGLQEEGARLGLEADMARRQGLRVPGTVEQRIAQINEQLKAGFPQERPTRYTPPEPPAEEPSVTTAPEDLSQIAEEPAPQKAPTGQPAPPVAEGDEPVINQPSPLNKRQIDNLIPFNIQGNKTKLIAKHIGGLIEKAAAASRRVIDAFAGSGTYTHYIRERGLGKKGDILNEFDPLRHITHKQIRENPEAVAKAVQGHVDELRKLLDVKPGEDWSVKAEEARNRVGDWFRRKFASYIKPGQDLVALTKSRSPVEMQDSPELAGLYTVAQNQAFSFIPMNAELSPKPRMFGTLKQPGFGVVIKAAENKVGHFKNEQAATVNAGPIIKAAGERFQGLDVRRGDGWKLIREEAGDGDFVPVDTSYLNKGNEVTTNYNAATREDATPSVWLRKVQENLLPAWDRGAKLLITNNYDPLVARQLRELGFEVHTAERSSSRGAGVVAETSKEIVATNFDHNTGEVYPRRVAVLRQNAEGINRPVEQRGGAAGGTGRPQAVAPEPQVKNEPVSGRPTGVTDAGSKPSTAGETGEQVRPRVDEKAPLRQPGAAATVRQPGDQGSAAPEKAVIPKGNPDAEIDAPDYIPTTEAVKSAKALIGGDAAFRAEVARYPFQLSKDPQVQAMGVESAARGIIRRAQQGKPLPVTADEIEKTYHWRPPEAPAEPVAGDVYGSNVGRGPEPVAPPRQQPPQQGVPPGVEKPPQQGERDLGGQPDQPSPVQALPETEAIGPSHEKLTGTYGKEAIKRGQVLEPEELAARGRQDVTNGTIDPYQVASKVTAGEAVSPRELAAVVAEHENLARDAIEKGKAATANPSAETEAAYREARQVAEDFAVNTVKPAGTMWGELGRALQTTARIDPSTEIGLRNAAIIRLGRELTESEASRVRKLYNQTKKTVAKSDAANEKLSGTIERKTKGTATPTEAEMHETLQKVLKDLTPCS